MEELPRRENHTPSAINSARVHADELLTRRSEELLAWQGPSRNVVAYGATAAERPVLDFGRSGIQLFLRQVKPELLRRFSAHGIARYDEKGNLAALLTILNTGELVGATGRLLGGGTQCAFTSGDFILVSHLDKELSLRETGASGGRRVAVGAYVVDTKLYPIIDDLRAMFPSANIIRANELADYIRNEVGKSDLVEG